MTLRQRIGYLFVMLAVRHLELMCWLFDWTLILKCGVLDRSHQPMTLDKAEEISEERRGPDAKA